MPDAAMRDQISNKPGFLAALDQSGGSTPGALKAYGIPESAYHGDDEMFKLMHDFRVRIITSPAFTGEKVIGAILFERTMDGAVDGTPVPTFLWKQRGVVPFLKVDQGLQPENDGVQLMKPIKDLDPLLARAVTLGVYGTKMRSTINLPHPAGVAAIAAQQFEVAAQIAKHGLVPILEPEVLIKSPDKPGAEALLRSELHKGLDAWTGEPVMLKLTIPDAPDFYADLIAHPKVQRVVALSGGYTRADACERLSHQHGMIASFSRALVDGLSANMTAAEFDAELGSAIDEIYTASTVKTAAAVR